MASICIIIPIYNVEKYIHRCIDSILNQTYHDFELILIDDGSSDSSGKICDEYADKDSRIVVFHQENQGQSVARNAGLNWIEHNSNSEWITFVDSDDWIATDYLEVLLKLCKKYEAPISMCQYVHCKDQTVESHNTNVEYLAVPARALLNEEGLVGYAWAKLYRRDVILRYRFPEGMYMEDFYIIPEIILSAQRIAVTEKTLYYYYINENSTLGTLTLKKFKDAWKGYEHQIELFTQHDEISLRNMQINSYIKNIAGAYNLVVSKKREYTDEDAHSIKEYGKRVLKQYKNEIDYTDEQVVRALGVFQARYRYRNRINDIMNHSNFFAIKGLRGFYYKTIFPIAQKRYLKSYQNSVRSRLRNNNFSIICSNCIGGFIYHRLGLQFLSPTINCFIEPSDFIRFCEHLEYYLSLRLEFIESDKPYPVARLDDVTVYFNHSNSKEEAESTWEKRKNRVNYDKLYVILYNRYDENDTPLTKEEILRAGRIKCNNLIILSDIPCPDVPYVLYIPKKGKDLGQLYFDQDKYLIRTFEKEFDFVSFLNINSKKDDCNDKTDKE